MRTVTSFVAAGLLLVAAGSANHAQQPQQQPVPPQFRAAINFVEVDASVLDRTRRPIRGLASVNFQVLEDGKPQEILAFSEIDVPDPPEVSTPWLRDVPPDVKTNILASDRRLIVLVLEDGIVGMDLHAKRVKEIGKRIVDKLGPGDLMAVMFTRDIKKSRDFTADRSKLLAAIDGYATGYSGTGGAGNAIEQFVNLAKVFADVPQRRKTLIYVSSGWAVDFLNPKSGQEYQLRLRLEDAFEKAQRANVNIYTIDPVGLSDQTVAGSEGPPPEDAAMRLSPSLQTLAGDPTSLAGPLTLSREFLLTVANNTGGLAVINNNDFNPGITQIFRENNSYYLLGYRSPNDKLDGKFRQIDVRVNVPDATVRARTGYFGPRPASGTPPSPLAKAISGLLPTSEIGMQVGVAPFAIPGRDETALALTLAVRQAMPPDRVTLNESVGLLISAFGTLGERRTSQGLQAKLALQRTNDEWVRYEVVSQMNLKPGRYQLRFATSSALQGRTGSIYYEVDVPDFRKPALSLSGVVMNVVPNVPSAPKGGLPNLIPVVPTTRRDFWEHDKVTAFLRIYQGGRQPAAAQLSTRIVDALGATVLELNDRIPAERFSVTRSADYYFELPTARLAPGPHLLTFEATLPGPKPVIARRDVRFTRRTK